MIENYSFDFKTLHGARGNTSKKRRRAFSLRLIGDDARYIKRPGRTSPPFPNHGMVPGQVLRKDWFPIIFEQKIRWFTNKSNGYKRNQGWMVLSASH